MVPRDRQNHSLAALLREADVERRAIDIGKHYIRGKTNHELTTLISATLSERAAYIAQYADAIGVRVELEGRWQNKMLSELPTPYVLVEAFRLLLRAEQPHRKIPVAESEVKP